MYEGVEYNQGGLILFQGESKDDQYWNGKCNKIICKSEAEKWDNTLFLSFLKDVLYYDYSSSDVNGKKTFDGEYSEG